MGDLREKECSFLLKISSFQKSGNSYLRRYNDSENRGEQFTLTPETEKYYQLRFKLLEGINSLKRVLNEVDKNPQISSKLGQIIVNASIIGVPARIPFYEYRDWVIGEYLPLTERTLMEVDLEIDTAKAKVKSSN